MMDFKKIMSTEKIYALFFSRFSRRDRRQSGIILIIVLWVMVILSLLVMGLGRRASIELELMKYSMTQAKLKHIAMAGVRYAMYHIQESFKQKANERKTTKYQCGFVLQEGQSPDEIFKDVYFQDGFFSIAFQVEGDGTAPERYGFTDEESRININQLTSADREIFQYILQYFGVEEELSKQITAALIDWRDLDGEVINGSEGAEDDYYESLTNPYSCKNGPFDSVQELLLVRGMTLDIFEKIRPYITVFSSNMNFVLNLNTAPKPCLWALARHYAGPETNTELGDADSLVEKLVIHRNGMDELWATEDDVPIDIQKMSLNAKERVIAFLMKNNQTTQSNFFRVNVKARDAASLYETQITAIIKAEDGSIVYWQRL